MPAVLLAVFFVPALFVASVVPYREWDSLAFGFWSRLIAEQGDLFPGGLIDLQLQRPLFYVAQGLLWLAFGYHEWLGRWLSVFFGLIFALAALAWTRAVIEEERARAVTGSLVVGVALSSSILASWVGAGMTDIPVSAMAALTAALLWSHKLGRARLPFVALAAAAAVLAKPTGLLALPGLAIGWLVYTGLRAGRRRILEGLVPLTVGGLAGLAYDYALARSLDESLTDFIRAGSEPVVIAAVSGQRWDVLLRAEWLGTALGLVVVYGLVYGLACALSGRRRLAATLAAPAALLWSMLGPFVADGSAPFPLRVGSGLGLAAWIGVAITILAAPLLAPVSVIDRRIFALLTASVLPAMTAWAVYRPDQTRLLSPVWAPLVLLSAASLCEAALSLAKRWRPAVLLPGAAVSLLVLANVVNIDRLGRDGWSDLLRRGPGGWSSRASMEDFAYGSLRYALLAAQANAGPTGRLLSNDGRLVYFFPGRAEYGYPRSCSELRGFQVLVLLTAGESAEVLEASGGSVDPLAWLQCRSPRLHAVDERPGTYATFTIGTPARRTPAPASCGVQTRPGQMLDAVFAQEVSYQKARAVYRRAADLGFTGGLRIERTGCDTFRVLLTGVPSRQNDNRREAASVGFRIEIVPAVRYPVVSATVDPMR
jgi:hypothetical protein